MFTVCQGAVCDVYHVAKQPAGSLEFLYRVESDAGRATAKRQRSADRRNHTRLGRRHKGQQMDDAPRRRCQRRHAQVGDSSPCSTVSCWLNGNPLAGPAKRTGIAPSPAELRTRLLPPSGGLQANKPLSSRPCKACPAPPSLARQYAALPLTVILIRRYSAGQRLLPAFPIEQSTTHLCPSVVRPAQQYAVWWIVVRDYHCLHLLHWNKIDNRYIAFWDSEDT